MNRIYLLSKFVVRTSKILMVSLSLLSLSLSLNLSLILINIRPNLLLIQSRIMVELMKSMFTVIPSIHIASLINVMIYLPVLNIKSFYNFERNNIIPRTKLLEELTWFLHNPCLDRPKKKQLRQEYFAPKQLLL